MAKLGRHVSHLLILKGHSAGGAVMGVAQELLRRLFSSLGERSGGIDMVAYEIYWFDQKGGYQMIGVLPERRKNPMRITKESVMNWGKMLLGNDVDSKNISFKRVTIDSLADRILWHDLSNYPINIIS